MNQKQSRKPATNTAATSLSAVDLFRGLPESRLRAIAEASEVREVRAGQVVFQSGKIGEALFVLEQGAVQTYRASGAKKLIIAEFKPTAVFGEMGCVGQCVYHCSAEATEPSRLRVISRPAVDALLGEHPTIARRLLDLVSQRFVEVLMNLDATSFRQLMPRLAGLLLEKAEGDFVHNMTHKNMAEHLRVYRESATAALGELKEAGIIAVERKKIHILSRTRLERAARE